MMLNLQFAETMELTEAELEKVYGGDFVYVANISGGGGIGPSPYGAFDWMKGLWAGLAERRRK